MKKTVIVTCLLLLSVVAAGKMNLLLTPQALPDTHITKQDVDKVQLTTKAPDDILLSSSEWLISELIPSAEAAKAITLDEEKYSSQGGEAKSIQQERLRLEEKELALNEREQAVLDAESRAAKKIVALEALHTRIQALLDEEESIKDKKIKRLTSVYEGMKAERAAPVIAQMDLTIVVKMFLRMNEKQVGKILSFLPTRQAVVISQALTKRVALASE